MSSSQQLAKHFREVYFGGNWTDVNLRDSLDGISWQQATAEVYGLNSIAMLVYHIHYYVIPVSKVFLGEVLIASDRNSFDLPPIYSAEDWHQLQNKVFEDAELFASQIEQFDEEKLFSDFPEEKYGCYYKNILGIIEHSYYHLGQISLIKKILQ